MVRKHGGRCLAIFGKNIRSDKRRWWYGYRGIKAFIQTSGQINLMDTGRKRMINDPVFPFNSSSSVLSLVITPALPGLRTEDQDRADVSGLKESKNAHIANLSRLIGFPHSMELSVTFHALTKKKRGGDREHKRHRKMWENDGAA